MKLSFVSNFNSITNFDSIEIRDFSIITGLNGSGKTHLLRAIENGAVKVEGLDHTEINYYNYNDFNLHYNQGSAQSNNSISNAQQRYSQKGQALSQRITQERYNILSTYSVLRQDFNQFLDTIEMHGRGMECLSWSQEEIEQYQQVIETEGFKRNPWEYLQQLSSPKVRTVMEMFGGNVLPINVKDDLISIQQLLPKRMALKFIQQFAFNPDVIIWSSDELSIYEDLRKDNPAFNIWEHDIQTMFSPNFINFISAYQNFQQYLPPLTLESITVLIDDTKMIFCELEAYLIEKLPAHSLKILRGVFGMRSLLGPVNSESGFLDLTQIADEEKQYQILDNRNRYNRFLHLNDGKKVSYLSDEAFLAFNGKSPVALLNEALSKYDCNGYEFRRDELPNQYGIDSNNYNINITLYNKRKNFPTTLEALSSGERTLLALTFYVFKLKYRKKMISSLLLLDEIDSSLHPSMSKRVIDVLYGLFYEELGIKIIISTHSPSTVAFAPDNSLYVMRSDGDKRLIESSKDAALKELTFGVPSFSINYENRRQVFVESKYDVEYYENLYRIFKKKLHPEVSLNFIASGDVQKDGNGLSKSSCDQVNIITKLLRDSGNQFVWGIIDWDLNEKGPDCRYVKVLGWQKRYSIENYIFDPLHIAILLLLEKIKEPVDFELEDSFKIYHILSFDSTQIQTIIDKVISWLNIQHQETVAENISYKTNSGLELTLPSYFVKHQGHKLEDKYLEAFPKLQGIKKGQESTLKIAIIKKVIEEYEELAPDDLIEVLKSVQEV